MTWWIAGLRPNVFKDARRFAVEGALAALPSTATAKERLAVIRPALREVPQRYFR